MEVYIGSPLQRRHFTVRVTVFHMGGGLKSVVVGEACFVLELVQLVRQTFSSALPFRFRQSWRSWSCLGNNN